MKQYIDRAAVIAEIEKRIKEIEEIGTYLSPKGILTNLLCYINTLEVIDPYEQCVQYDSIKAGIQAHAETYSFNIESKLFNQLTTEEQQALWRKEIEQACVSGGEVGVELARDPRYKENIKVKEVNLELENENNNPKITVGTKIRLKTNPDVILSIISNDCHEDEFECSNGSVLSLKQIEKYYDIYIEENNHYKE